MESRSRRLTIFSMWKTRGHLQLVMFAVTRSIHHHNSRWNALFPPVIKGVVVKRSSPPAARKKTIGSKLDENKYGEMLYTKLHPGCFKELSMGQLDVQLQKFCTTLVETATKCAPVVKPGEKKDYGLWIYRKLLLKVRGSFSNGNK